MDISIRHHPIIRYIFHSKPHLKNIYCEVISKRILIIFAPEEAELCKDYIFYFGTIFRRLHLFSYDFKIMFAF
jgi:hypothetical protein